MKVLYKHIISLAVFISLTIFIFNPIFFENKSIKQHALERIKDEAQKFKPNE